MCVQIGQVYAHAHSIISNDISFLSVQNYISQGDYDLVVLVCLFVCLSFFLSFCLLFVYLFVC